MPGGSRRSVAFTLIEVVVGLGLGVVLLVAVQGIVVHAQRAGAALERRAAEAAVQALPFELLVQDLDSRPAGGGLSLRDGELSFTTLNALQSARIAARHVVAVGYRVERIGAGSCRLTRRERELGEQASDETGVVLASGLARAMIEIHDGRTWWDHWPLPTPRPATAVRLTTQRPACEPREQVAPVAPLRWSRHDE
jgi:hypothetical protein